MSLELNMPSLNLNIIMLQISCAKKCGLVVMGGGSRSEGCGFKSRHHILDGHFSHVFVVKIVMMFV